MKLELKHLAPYLPYGLNIKYKRSIFYITSVAVNISAVIKIERYHNHKYYNEVWLIEDDRFKPILRPLSSLDNEEVRKYLLQLDLGYTDWTTIERNAWIKKYGYDGWINQIPFGIIKYLLQNHYDVFGLIDQGLAVDINTLIQRNGR